MSERRRLAKCIACGRKVEWEAWAAGPVCYPCYWGAKLVYESHTFTVEDIPPALQPMLETFFKNGGYNWPSDLTWGLVNRHFDKCDNGLRRWWSARGGVGDRGIRDPEAPCNDFDPSPPQLGDFRDCESDGHYLCKECKHYAGASV